MRVHYDAKTDLLYIRLDERRQKVINKRISDGIVLDIGKGRKIVGIEILDASKRLNVKGLIPSKIEIVSEAAQKERGKTSVLKMRGSWNRIETEDIKKKLRDIRSFSDRK